METWNGTSFDKVFDDLFCLELRKPCIGTVTMVIRPYHKGHFVVSFTVYNGNRRPH